MIINKERKQNNFTKKKSKLFCFLFPLYPIKPLLKVNFICLIAIMIALRIVMGYLSIYIPSINTTLSFAWTPVIIMGWVFGPIYGFVFGFVFDTIAFFLKPTTAWFWMYAIQEPMVGMISGLISSLYFLNIKKINFNNIKIIGLSKNIRDKKVILTLIFQQLFSLSFVIFCITGILLWMDGNHKFEYISKMDESFFKISKYIIISLISLFFIILEIFTFFVLKRFDRKKIILSLWIICMSLFFSVFFSFFLGPITSIEYINFINGTNAPKREISSYWITFYLIPRVFKETIKAPIQILLLISSIPIVQMYIDEYKKNVLLKW